MVVVADKAWDTYKKKKAAADKKMAATAKRKPKSADAGLMAKPIKKASQSGKAAVAKAGELQRREMARTRLKQQQGRMTAAQRQTVTQRDKDMAAKKREKATRKAFLRSI